jgi:pimeloyl-ACP methyl ester carboxylesterase
LHRGGCPRAWVEGYGGRGLEPRRPCGAQRRCVAADGGGARDLRYAAARQGAGRAFGFKALSATVFTPAPSDAEIETWIKSAFAPGYGPIPSFVHTDFRNTDGAARGCLGANAQKGNFADEVEIVRNLKIPLAILQGAEEQVVNPDYLQRLTAPTLWRRQVQVIPDAGHTPQWEQAEAFDKLLDEFASSL